MELQIWTNAISHIQYVSFFCMFNVLDLKFAVSFGPIPDIKRGNKKKDRQIINLITLISYKLTTPNYHRDKPLRTTCHIHHMIYVTVIGNPLLYTPVSTSVSKYFLGYVVTGYFLGIQLNMCYYVVIGVLSGIQLNFLVFSSTNSVSLVTTWH